LPKYQLSVNLEIPLSLTTPGSGFADWKRRRSFVDCPACPPEVADGGRISLS
jgi:hypothetical protein